jgi:hypothetical protein
MPAASSPLNAIAAMLRCRIAGRHRADNVAAETILPATIPLGDQAMETHDTATLAGGFRKADYGVFFGEPGSIGDPVEVLRHALGASLVAAEPLGDGAVELHFADDGRLSVLNDLIPVLAAHRMLGYEDAEIPYDRYKFEIGFARDLADPAEASAVLALGRRLEAAGISVMVERDGQDVVPLGS